MNIKKSNELKERSRKIYPALTGTFSRSASSFVEGVYPVYAEYGNGSKFVDVDGNEYLDFLCGLGPITLGYNYKPVNEAAEEQLRKGVLFSLPHPIELELSETIIDVIPNAEMVKFEKSGSNAVTAAVRAARGYTKKEKIAYCGSGGVWHDWQAAMVSRDGGVPKFNAELIKIFEYNDYEGLERIFEENKNEIATIVLEPVIFSKPDNNFLKNVRKIADANNAVLILDEVVTGFRFDIGGGQKYFNLEGDLICFGKGMGNGYPISAITGKSEYMKIFDELWVSSSNNMETISMAASNATILEMKTKNTISKCWETGKKLKDGWNKISNENALNAKIEGYEIRMNLVCKDSKGNDSFSLKSLILQEMVKNGIFMAPLNPIYISYSHSNEDIDRTLTIFEKICKEIKQKISSEEYEKYLEGKMPKTVWTMKIKPTKKI